MCVYMSQVYIHVFICMYMYLHLHSRRALFHNKKVHREPGFRAASQRLQVFNAAAKNLLQPS